MTSSTYYQKHVRVIMSKTTEVLIVFVSKSSIYRGGTARGVISWSKLLQKPGAAIIHTYLYVPLRYQW